MPGSCSSCSGPGTSTTRRVQVRAALQAPTGLHSCRNCSTESKHKLLCLFILPSIFSVVVLDVVWRAAARAQTAGFS